MKSSLLVEILLVTSLLAAAGPTHASPTSGGPTRLTIDGSAAGFCSHDTNSCTVTVTTSQNNDILIAYTEESLDLQTSCTFSVSDTAGLSWAPRSPIVFGRYENGGYRDQIQEWWAKSIGILNSDMITESIFGCASGYGGEYNGLQVFGISGTNFNNPFDPNSSLPGSGSDSISGQSSVATAIISTSDPNDMLFAGFQPGAVVVATPQSGFATITGFGSEYEVTNGTVTNSTVTFSMSSISYWEIIADAVVAGGPDFVVSMNPASLLIPPNSTIIPVSTVRLSSLGNFTGPVALTVQVSPSGLGVSLGASSLLLLANSQNETSLQPVVTPATPPGTYNVTVTATSGQLSHSSRLTVILEPALVGSFGIAVDPSFLTLQLNQQPYARSFITVTSLEGFSGTVNLEAAVVTGPGNFTGPTVFLPLEVSVNPSQVSLSPGSSANASLTVIPDPGLLPGTYLVNVTGTQNSQSKSVFVTVQVIQQPPPDFNLYLTISSSGSLLIAGQSAPVGVYLYSVGPGFFDGTVMLTGQVSPLVANGPILSFNPSQISLEPPGPSTSTLTVSTSAATPPGNYTVTLTGTSGVLVHSVQFTLRVLPPPVLTLSPSTGVLGTKVLVQGSGFPNPSAGPFPSTVEVEMSFDNQLLGFIFLQGSSFNFTFNVPLSQPGLHKVHAVELYPFSLDVTADFTVLAQPTPSVLTVSVNVGAIYFPGETTSIFVLSSLNGQPTPASSLQVVLIRPNGSRLALSPVSIGIGEWKASFTVPVSGSIGTYVVNAHVHVGNTGAGSDGSAITVFEVKPTWLQGHTTTLVGATATIGALGIVAVAWRKGFLTRRKEEFPT